MVVNGYIKYSELERNVTYNTLPDNARVAIHLKVSVVNLNLYLHLDRRIQVDPYSSSTSIQSYQATTIMAGPPTQSFGA